MSNSDDSHSKIKTYDYKLSTDPCLQNTFGVVFKYYKPISAVATTFRLFFFNLAQILLPFAQNLIKNVMKFVIQIYTIGFLAYKNQRNKKITIILGIHNL